MRTPNWLTKINTSETRYVISKKKLKQEREEKECLLKTINLVNNADHSTMDNTDKSDLSCDPARHKQKKRPTDTENAEITDDLRPFSILIGDSMIKNMDEQKLSRANRNKVNRICLSGAKIKDTHQTLINIIEDSPTPPSIIIHAGSNNLKTTDHESKIV